MRLRTWFFILIGIALFLFGHGAGPFREVDKDAIAYEASSSTNFFLHGGGVDSMAKTGSSSSFIEYAAGGQAISGRASSSASFISLKGIINLIFRNFIPKYEQIHYHWRNDDGTEATATSATSGIEDTAYPGTLAKSTVKRLRFEISNEGGIDSISAQQFRVEYGLKVTTCAAIVTYTDVGAVGGDWDMGASSLTEAADTTNIAIATGGMTDENNSFLTPNGSQRETTSQTGNLTVYNNKFVEMEYAIQALAGATDSGVYCFRLTNAGSATNFTYTKYPEVTLAAGGAASLTLTLDGGGVVAFGTITSGTRLTGTTRLKVTQTSATSINITAGRQRANTTPATLASNAFPNIVSNQIDDDINGIDVFNGISPGCTTVGSHPAIWPSQGAVSTGLGFSNWAASTGKDTTCWGTGTTQSDSLNQYAALQASSSASSFINISSSPPATLYTSIGYSLEVRSTQKATLYSGGVVFTATALP